MKLRTSKDLRDYQWDAFWFVVKRRAAGLFLDMGLGKTIIILSAIKHLKHKGIITKPVLLVAPIRVIYNVWRQEAVKWTHTRNLQFNIVHGSEKQRIAALNEPADVYLINPHNIVWILELFDTKKSKENWPFEWLIIDESSLFKAAGTQRFKKLRYFVSLFKRRNILTGTPTPNHLLDIWAQIFILDNGERLGTSFNRFRDRYCFPGDREGHVYVPRRGAAQHIMNSIGDIVLRMEAPEHFKTLYNPVYVELPRRAREMYDHFEEEMFLELEQGDVEALNAATLSGRCHQLANGAIYTIDRDTSEKIWEPVHDAKLEALEEIIEQTGTPCLVIYGFKHDLARLRAKYPHAPVMGQAKKIGEYIAGWQKDKYPVVLAHANNLGYGLDGMQHGSGHTIIFFSLTWSREAHDQLIARMAGARATKSITVHYIIARSTVDEAIMLSGQQKHHTQRDLLNALRQYRREVRHQDVEDFDVLD